jgi:apolipoprotein D and lipocalin family protein
MQKTLFLTAALAVLGMVNARISSGVCSTPELQAGFDATKYTGTWFNAAKDKNSPFENGNCEQARYSINADGTLRVYNSMYDNATETISTADGKATCVGPQCSVSFFWFSPPADYRVMDTDYENYALVYACNNVFLAKVDFVWILTREQHPKQEYIDQALATLKARVPEFTPDNLSWTYQGSACQYLKDETIPAPQ